MSETNNYIAYLMCFLLRYDKAKKAALVRRKPYIRGPNNKGKNRKQPAIPTLKKTFFLSSGTQYLK